MEPLRPASSEPQLKSMMRQPAGSLSGFSLKYLVAAYAMPMPVALSIAPGDAVRGFLSAHSVMRKHPGMTKRGMRM